MAQLDKVIKYFNADEKFYSLEKIEELIEAEGKILKDDSRSLVKLIEIDGKKIVIKSPVDKNRRKLVRLLTLFRKSEAVKMLESMDYLNKNYVPTNEAILSIEYKNNNMVFDSYIFFSFLDGEVVKSNKSKEVIDLIRKIHKLGYLHGDTQVRNFLNNNGKVSTIDAALKKKKFGAISENLEYIGFGVDIAEAYDYINRDSLAFKFANCIYVFFRTQRRLKKKMRNALKRKKN